MKEILISRVKFFEKANEIIDFHMPIKKLSQKEIKLQCKPWITPAIRKSMKRRDILHRKFIRAKDPIRKEELHNDYKRLRNRILALSRASKTLHYKNFFSSHSKNVRKTWKGIKSIISIRQTIDCHSSSLMVNGEMTNDPLKIANSYNNYFSNIADKLQNKINSTGVDFSSYLGTPTEQTFLFEPAGNRETLWIIAFLGNKSLGPNSLPNEVLSVIENSISYPLTQIINISLETGIYPSMLKEAKVVPI